MTKATKQPNGPAAIRVRNGETMKRTWNEINEALTANGFSAKRILGIIRNLPTFPAQGAVQTYDWNEINEALTASNVPARSIAKILTALALDDVSKPLNDFWGQQERDQAEAKFFSGIYGRKVQIKDLPAYRKAIKNHRASQTYISFLNTIV